MPDDVCANCMCELVSDCCGTSTPYLVDEIAYCCEACAEDGYCDCGCVAPWVQDPVVSSGTPGPSAFRRR